MLVVDTQVRDSPIHGKGCFSKQFIAKNQFVWIYSDDEIFEEPVDIYEHYGYFDTIIMKYVYPMDDARFINHSEDPNTYSSHGYMLASRNIYPGEEITENYHEYMIESDTQKHLGDKEEKEDLSSL